MSGTEVAVISLAIDPKTDADRAKLNRGLQQFWPRIRPSVSGPRPQPARLSSRPLVSCTSRSSSTGSRGSSRSMPGVGRPQILYKEALTQPADGESKYFTQSGGQGRYGHVKVHLYPAPPGAGYSFENRTTGNGIPHRFIKPIEAGLDEARRHGVVAGYPVDDLRVELYDGSHHDGDSSALAFTIAASMAFQDGAKKAKPVLLEPVNACHCHRANRVPRRRGGRFIAAAWSD